MKKTLYSLTYLFIFSLMISCSNGGVKSSSNDQSSERKDISLQLYSLRDMIGNQYNEALKGVSDIGYSSIEAAGYDDGKFYGRTPAEFKTDLEAVGLTALSSHTSRGLSEEELAKKDFTEALKWWNKCLDASIDAGMKYVVCPWMDTPKTLADLNTYCEYYNKIGELAKSKGIKFGYHNHAFEFQKIEDKVMYDYMLENTNPENVFFQMDVYWVVIGGQSPVDYFHKYPKRFKLLHIKDQRELGQSGMVGFDAIFKSENTDIAGVESIIVEVEKYSYEPLKSVQVSFDYLQNLAGVKHNYLQ